MTTRRVLRCSVFKIKQVPGERATALCLSADRAQGDDAHIVPDHSPIFAWTKQNRQKPWLRRPPIQPSTVK